MRQAIYQHRFIWVFWRAADESLPAAAEVAKTISDSRCRPEPLASSATGIFSTAARLCVTLSLLSAPVLAQSPYRPNIVLIMSDDQGWGDVAFPQQLSPNPDHPADQSYPGHPALKTPQLDTMRQAGLQFHRFYAAAPVCSPTRASFVTGRHHRRTTIDYANSGHLLNRELTIAEIAKTQGYTTGHFGKWHMGTLDKSVNSVDSNRGGTSRLPGSATHYSTPWNNGYDTTFATESKTQTFNPTDISPPTHYWTGHEQSLALTDPSLDGDDSRVMMDRIIPFVQDAANSGQPFMTTIWFHTPHKPYSALDQATLDQFYSPAEQAVMDSNQKAYFAAITAMDQQVGRLRQTLQTLGIADDTLLIFTSDNGPENGVPGVGDIAKGDLRGNKRHLYEGGVRVPGLVEWPGQVAASSTTNATGGVIDLLPTLMDIWDLGMPDDRPLDGESLLPVFKGTATQRSTSMKWDIEARRSIVDSAGRFKAISNNSGGSWELYDLIADPKETTNLAGSNPTKLSELTTEWNSWRTGVDNQRTLEIDYDDYVTSAANVRIDVSNPASFVAGDEQNDTPTLFVERQFATLDVALSIDSSGAAGSYDQNNQPPGATIPAGTAVDSYLVHFNPAMTTTTNITITFDNNILGVIAGETRLAGSDFLAFANPQFGGGDRGILEPGEADGWTIAADGRTITIDLDTSGTTIDEMRILTESSPFIGGFEPPLWGDLDDNGVIDVGDWEAFLSGLNADLSDLSPAEAYQRGDLVNGDLSTDHADYLEFKRLYEIANGPGTFAALGAIIPEPSSLTMLGLGGMVLACGGRSRQLPPMQNDAR